MEEIYCKVNETPQKKIRAQIRTGAIVGCDMHQCSWENKGEYFEVKDFINDTRKLVAPYYGGQPYGNGALYVKVNDLIYENTICPPLEVQGTIYLEGKLTGIKEVIQWLEDNNLSPLFEKPEIWREQLNKWGITK